LNRCSSASPPGVGRDDVSFEISGREKNVRAAGTDAEATAEGVRARARASKGAALAVAGVEIETG